MSRDVTGFPVTKGVLQRVKHNCIEFREWEFRDLRKEFGFKNFEIFRRFQNFKISRYLKRYRDFRKFRNFKISNWPRFPFTVGSPNLSTTPYRTVPYRFPLQFFSRSRSLSARRTVFFCPKFSVFLLKKSKAQTVPYLK